MEFGSWHGSPWSSCGAISKLLSARFQTPTVARWRRPGLSIETSGFSPSHVDGQQQQLPSLLHSRRHLERECASKSIQQGCCLRECHDVKTQTQEQPQILTQMQKAQTRSCATSGSVVAFGARRVDGSGQSLAVAAVPIVPGHLGNFSGLKSPAGSNRVHPPVRDAAWCQVRDMPAAVGRAVPCSWSDQSEVVGTWGESPNIQLSRIGSLEHARSAGLEGAASCRPAEHTSVLQSRSCFSTPREPLPRLQEERSTCRSSTRQFPLLVRQDELTLVDQQVLWVDAYIEDSHAPSLRLTSQEFEVWFQPGPLGVYVADVQTGHVTEVFDGQVKAHGIGPGLQLLTLDGEPYSEALLERKVNGSAPYRVVFKQPLDQQQGLGPAALEALPRRVPSQTSYVPQTDVLRGCQSFGTQALTQ